MNSAIIVLIEEKNRLERAFKVYSQKIDELPKGSLQAKKRASQKFYYRVFRDEFNKHKSVYLGKESSKAVLDARELIQNRKELEFKRKQIKNELKSIERLIPINEQ